MTKILCLSDSPKLTTGFGNVAKQIYQGFHEAGYEVISFGFMDTEPDVDKELPYAFWPCTHFDMLGHQSVPMIISKVNPDILFILADPGNIAVYVAQVIHLQNLTAIGQANIKKFPIIAYTPIEGEPIPSNFATTFDQISRTKGRVVLYSPGSLKKVQESYPNLTNLEYAYHGSDHANFRKYEDSQRTRLRYVSGLTDYFIVGSFGVNKRTKGFDTLIYTAKALKDMKQAENIKFYIHTNFNVPSMNGYLLDDLAQRHGVSDMFLWKPNVDSEPGGNIRGIPRESSDHFTDKPETVEGRRDLFARFSYIDRMNVLDLYVDTSQVEGWGLPAFEAMKCGVPTISVKDEAIREEIYDTGCYWVNPAPKQYWTTWHTGVRLVTVDPYEVAKAILRLKKDHYLRNHYSKEGQEVASKYKWTDTRAKFNDIVKEVLNDLS